MPNTRICRTTLLLTVAIALTADVTQALSQAADESPLGRPWRYRRHLAGHDRYRRQAPTTFHADGTVINSVQGAVSTNPARQPHTSHHGVWRYLGDGTFGVAMWDIFYDIGTGQLIQLHQDPPRGDGGR